MHAVAAERQNTPNAVVLIDVVQVDLRRHAYAESNRHAEFFLIKVNPPQGKEQTKFATTLSQSKASMTDVPSRCDQIFTKKNARSPGSVTGFLRERHPQITDNWQANCLPI